MKNQEYKKRCAKVEAAALAALVLSAAASAPLAEAAQSMNPSAKEYNLSVEDLPDGVSKAYAKFHDGSYHAEDYMLSLFDGYDAMILMEEALTAAGEDLTLIEYQALEATVYEKDEEGDFYPIDDMPGITLICALPENFSKNSDSVQITAVDGKGALCRIDSKIVTVGGEDCVMFDLSVFSTYAVLYKQGGALTSGKKPTPTPTPVPKQNTPTKAPVNTAQNTPTQKPAAKTPTPVPTKAAEKTPTQKPAAPETVPTKEPVKTAQNTPTQKPATKTPTPASTKAPAKAGTSSGTSQAAAPVRDRTPQTGDSYCVELYFSMLAAGGVLTGLGVFLWRRKK